MRKEHEFWVLVLPPSLIACSVGCGWCSISESQSPHWQPQRVTSVKCLPDGHWCTAQTPFMEGLDAQCWEESAFRSQPLEGLLRHTEPQVKVTPLLVAHSQEVPVWEDEARPPGPNQETWRATGAPELSEGVTGLHQSLTSPLSHPASTPFFPQVWTLRALPNTHPPETPSQSQLPRGPDLHGLAPSRCR